MPRAPGSRWAATAICRSGSARCTRVYRTPYRSIVFLVPIALIFALGAPLDQVITFSILSGLLGYTFMSFNMIMFRSKWPLGSIKRGYVHPFHPLPAIVLLVLCAATYFAVFLGYGTQLIAMMCFYIVVSLWFHFWRYTFVRRGDQFTMPWPRPAGLLTDLRRAPPAAAPLSGAVLLMSTGITALLSPYSAAGCRTLVLA